MNTKTDPIDGKYHLPKDQLSHGWIARSGNDLLAVLSHLSTHLANGNDHYAQQLLACVWRKNSPVLAQVARLPDPDAADKCPMSLTVKANLPAAPQLAPVFPTVHDIQEHLTGHLIDGSHQRVVIDQDDATREAFVKVGSGLNERTYHAGSVLAALRVAIDGEKELGHVSR